MFWLSLRFALQCVENYRTKSSWCDQTAGRLAKAGPQLFLDLRSWLGVSPSARHRLLRRQLCRQWCLVGIRLWAILRPSVRREGADLRRQCGKSGWAFGENSQPKGTRSWSDWDLFPGRWRYQCAQRRWQQPFRVSTKNSADYVPYDSIQTDFAAPLTCRTPNG
jgi:hypothetical protein